jgi:uncharacterized protein Usg
MYLTYEDIMLAFEQQLRDYRLTTVDVTYFLPDYPGVLQTFIWQCLDLPPQFPVIGRFLTYWETRLDGRLHSVRIGHGAALVDGRWRHLGDDSVMH